MFATICCSVFFYNEAIDDFWFSSDEITFTVNEQNCRFLCYNSEDNTIFARSESLDNIQVITVVSNENIQISFRMDLCKGYDNCYEVMQCIKRQSDKSWHHCIADVPLESSIEGEKNVFWDIWLEFEKMNKINDCKTDMAFIQILYTWYCLTRVVTKLNETPGTKQITF